MDISPDEFAYQIAFDSVEPPMAQRLEFMIAQLTACFVAVNRGKKGKAPKPSEFMLSTMMRETDHSTDTDIETKIRATFSLFPTKSK